MAHQSLYRRYRSQRFSEVRGQDQVVNALRSAVAEGRVGHAYLFSGPRGTGKTSTARILAKALNCEDLHDGEPCGTCPSCLAMQAGTSYDLQELDAASNNKVEDVRSLVERVALGSPGRTKVYILDEVHMLSVGASNALLKTLEEPPDHVVFVLATTDPQKVLPTIRSRTQHFEFHLLPADVMADHVRWVIGDAGLDVDDATVEHVLRAGGGSARDTLSALDQAAAGGVSDAGDHAGALAEAVVASDVAAALSAVATATAAGRDPRVLGEALLAHLRDVFLHRMGGPQEHLSDTARQQVEAWAGRVTDRAVTRALEEVGEALLAMRQAPDPRIPLEVALVRVTRPAPVGIDPGADLADLVARIERLEKGASAPPPPPASSPSPRSTPGSPAGATPAPVAPRSSEPAAPALAAAPVPPAAPTTLSVPVADGDDGEDDVPEQLPPEDWLEPEDGSAAPAPVAATEVAPAPGPPAGDAGGAGLTGAALARATLARRGASPASAAPGSGTAPPPPPPPATRPGGGASSPDGPPAPVAPPAPTVPDAPAPEAPADAPPPPADAVPSPSTGSPLGRDEATTAWPQVLSALDRKAKALFGAGQILEVADHQVTIGLSSAPHLARCEPHRGALEAAFAVVLARPVTVVLAVGGAAADDDRAPGDPPAGDDPPPGRPGSRSTPATVAPPPAEEVREPASVPSPPVPSPPEIDAAPSGASPPASPAEQQQQAVDRVAQAFSGARIVER